MRGIREKPKMQGLARAARHLPGVCGQGEGEGEVVMRVRTRALGADAMQRSQHTPGDLRAVAKTAHALGHPMIALACRGVSMTLAGRTLDQAGEAIGVSRQRVHQWVSEYRNGGLSSLTKNELRQCSACQSVTARSLVVDSECSDCRQISASQFVANRSKLSRIDRKTF